jgi:hypothetical protein
VIRDSLNDVNWPAVGAALVAALAIGLVWFSPSAVGGFWARQVSRSTGMTEGEITSGAAQATALAKWLVSIGITAVVMALAVKAVGADSAGDGVVLGLVLGVGLGPTLSSWPPIFARMPLAVVAGEQRGVPAHAGRDGGDPGRLGVTTPSRGAVLVGRQTMKAPLSKISHVDLALSSIELQPHTGNGCVAIRRDPSPGGALPLYSKSERIVGRTGHDCSGRRPGAQGETPASWQRSSPGAPLGAPARC